MIGKGQVMKGLVSLLRSLESLRNYQNILIKRGMVSDLYLKKFALEVVWRLHWTTSNPMQILIIFIIQKNTLGKVNSKIIKQVVQMANKGRGGQVLVK